MKQLHISSRANDRVKYLSKLIELKSFRYQQGEYVIEGIRALDGLKSVSDLYIRDGSTPPDIKTNTLCTLSRKVFDSIADTDNSQGVMAVCAMPPADIPVFHGGRYILLDRLQDPGNLGTIMRTACAFGFSAVILAKGCADPFSPKAVRSAMGAEHRIPIVQLESLDRLKGCALIAADMAGRDICGYKWPESFVLCIGSEANGLSDELLAMAKDSVAIKMQGGMESLNAAVCTGIFAYASS